MSKIIVYLPVGLNHPELEVILSRTQLILDQGHEVDILLCSGKKVMPALRIFLIKKYLLFM